MEQLAHGHQSIVRRNRAVAVNGAIAQGVDHARLAEHRFANGLLETWFVDQGTKIILIR